MTNTLAVLLGLAILAGIAADLAVWDGEHLVFLGKRALALMDWLAVWR